MSDKKEPRRRRFSPRRVYTPSSTPPLIIDSSHAIPSPQEKVYMFFGRCSCPDRKHERPSIEGQSLYTSGERPEGCQEVNINNLQGYPLGEPDEGPRGCPPRERHGGLRGYPLGQRHDVARDNPLGQRHEVARGNPLGQRHEGIRTFPNNQPPPGSGFVPSTPHPGAAYAAVPTANPYGMFHGQTQLYATAQGPPPSYEQALSAHPALVQQQMYAPGAAAAAAAAAAASMYAAQGYPQYLGYPTAAYSPMQAYYPSLAYAYPQPQLRPTIMVPNGYDGGARFDGIAQQVIPPTPPGVPPSPAQLAAMAGHNVALTQKKGTFLAGSSDGGYTFW